MGRQLEIFFHDFVDGALQLSCIQAAKKVPSGGTVHTLGSSYKGRVRLMIQTAALPHAL